MRTSFIKAVSASLVVAFLVITSIAQNETFKVEHRLNHGNPDGYAQPPMGGTGSLSALLPHSGPVMSTPKIYLIWYGNWNQSNGTDNAAGQQIIRDWANGIGSSDYFKINGTYPGKPGPSTAGYGGEYTYTGSGKTRLSDNDILSIVGGSIGASPKLPYNAQGVYFVITSSNVAESSGFCSRYCGWHTAGNVSAGHVRYSFVGNAARCLNACAIQSTSPNGNAGVDGAISVLSHELEESATDPDLNAWYDSSGAENADKCAWTFGSSYQVTNGSWANQHIGSRDFLIQRNLFYNGTWFCARTSAGGQ